MRRLLARVLGRRPAPSPPTEQERLRRVYLETLAEMRALRDASRPDSRLAA
ncbi:MAG: hypothetical protein IRZ20_00880 [Thermoleophilia bacterium]|nr:hypothetical protein [Thermoleophilia bacterium]